ncbi:hypothetical protein A9Q83_12055 [Alphaproteobacteria bacterium 46_93_T64]|nr:hypothetical protein A9Q83_12055 [Alphaproteobacteria bacterium 46_93_T64]
MSAPKVSLEQWRILHSIITEGGFAQAAKKLNKSQSAVSYAVSKIQEQLGLDVLTINGRKAELTEAGELLLRRSRILLDEAENLEAAAKSLNDGWEATISIASEVLFPQHLLMAALDRLSEEAPYTRVEIIESVMSGTEDLIVQKKVDLAICGMQPAGYVGVPLMDMEFALVSGPDHPLAKQNDLVTFQQLSQYRQIVIRDSGEKRSGSGGWQKAEQRWTFSHSGTAREALKRGYGFSWAPTCSLIEEINRGEIVRLKIEGTTNKRVTLNLVYPNIDTAGPATKRLETLLLDVVDQHQRKFMNC